MNLQMDPLDNPLTTGPIQTGCEMSIEPYPNRRFGCIDDPDRQFGNGSVPTGTRTRSASPGPLLTLRTGDRPNDNCGMIYGFVADIFRTITNCKILQSTMLIRGNIGQVCLARCTYECHNHCSSRKLNLHIPPPVACVQLAVCWVTFQLYEAHQLQMKMRLKWKVCLQNCIHLKISL